MAIWGINVVKTYSDSIVEDGLLGRLGTSMVKTSKVIAMANIPSANVSSLVVGRKGFLVGIYLTFYINFLV